MEVLEIDDLSKLGLAPVLQGSSFQLDWRNAFQKTAKTNHFLKQHKRETELRLYSFVQC